MKHDGHSHRHNAATHTSPGGEFRPGKDPASHIDRLTLRGYKARATRTALPAIARLQRPAKRPRWKVPVVPELTLVLIIVWLFRFSLAMRPASLRTLQSAALALPVKLLEPTNSLSWRRLLSFWAWWILNLGEDVNFSSSTFVDSILCSSYSSSVLRGVNAGATGTTSSSSDSSVQLLSCWSYLRHSAKR